MYLFIHDQSIELIILSINLSIFYHDLSSKKNSYNSTFNAYKYSENKSARKCFLRSLWLSFQMWFLLSLRWACFKRKLSLSLQLSHSRIIKQISISGLQKRQINISFFFFVAFFISYYFICNKIVLWLIDQFYSSFDQTRLCVLFILRCESIIIKPTNGRVMELLEMSNKLLFPQFDYFSVFYELNNIRNLLDTRQSKLLPDKNHQQKGIVKMFVTTIINTIFFN